MVDSTFQIVDLILPTLTLVGFFAVMVVGVFNIAMERR